MPIHLPPISRREFLTRSLAAGAGLALGPSIQAAASRETDPNSWALLADPHLAADRAKVARGINLVEHFTKVTGEVLALPKRPAGVFIVGDCAFNTGEKGDYAVLTELLDPIRRDEMPVHLALGNHDERERFWEVLPGEKGAKPPLPGRQVSLLRTAYANWFMLDSLEKTNASPGFLGPQQLDWLAKTLDENPDKPALVLIHHNPGVKGNIGLRDTAALFETIRLRKQVKAYIFGHTHAWSVSAAESGIHLINLPAVSYIFHQGDPAGWVHGTLGENGMRVELRCVDTTHKFHGQQFDLQWRS